MTDEPTQPDITTIQRAEHSVRMSRYWQDEEWASKVRKKMKEARKTKKVINRMREALIDAGRERARKTGVTPQWMPKKVSVLETTGRWHTYDTIAQCAKHYGIKDSTMRAILRYGRTWQGMKFVTVPTK